jgi:hypothetical protein
MLNPLNLTINQILQALQTNLVLEDNIVGIIRTERFITRADYTSANGFNEIILTWPFPVKKRPQYVSIGGTEQPSNQPPLLKPITIPTWSYDQVSTVRIPFITGLESNSTYVMTFLIL